MSASQCLSGDFVKELIDTVGVRNWEELKGMHIRAEREDGSNGTILRIGHLLEDKWFDPKAPYSSHNVDASAPTERWHNIVKPPQVNQRASLERA